MHSLLEVNADIANTNSYLDKLYKALDSLSLKGNKLFERNKKMLLDAREPLKGLPGRPENYVTCYVHFLEAKLRFFKEFLQTTTASTETIGHLTAIKTNIELILQINKKYADTTLRDRCPPGLRDRLQKIEMEGITAANLAPLIPEMLKVSSNPDTTLANLHPKTLRRVLSKVLEQECKTSVVSPIIPSLIDLCTAAIQKNKKQMNSSSFFCDPNTLKTPKIILAESIDKILTKFEILKNNTKYQKLYSEVSTAVLDFEVYNLTNKAVRNFIAENNIDSIDENSFEGNLKRSLLDYYENSTKEPITKFNKPI